jgi:hypothetical protein
MPKKFYEIHSWKTFLVRWDTEHNESQHYVIQHNDNQHNDTQHSNKWNTTLALLTNVWTKLNILDGYKHSNFLWAFINYRRKKFYNIGPCSTF